MRDTIFALSSGHPPAGVAVIRISGPGVLVGLETMVGGIPSPRTVKLTEIRDRLGLLLDRGLVLFFPNPQSFTGEDVAEFQLHGSRATVAAVLSALAGLEGFRQAEPGEFTKRAFENGRIDLTEVEGLSDLIRAETEAQRMQALSQAEGALRSLYEEWANRLTHARAMIEAELDFSDEEDVPGSLTDRIWPDIAKLSEELADHLDNAGIGEIIRDGFRVALIGAPNAGKSSLLNCLAKRDVAIVSDIPGTTRDVIEVRLDIGGHMVLLQDTAGLRESADILETEGISRTHESVKKADLVLILVDPTSSSEDEFAPLSISAPMIKVWTKLDLTPFSVKPRIRSGVQISSKSGAGIVELVELIGEHLAARAKSPEVTLPTRERHVMLLKACMVHLTSALDGISAPIEVRAEYLRLAASELGRITGTVDVEDLLEVIFSEFCVGK